MIYQVQVPTACRDIQEGVLHYWQSPALLFERDEALHIHLPWARGGTHSTVPAGFSGTPVTAEVGGRAEALAAEQCYTEQQKASWSYTRHPPRVVAALPCTTTSLYGSSEIPLTCLEFVCVLTKTDQKAGLCSYQNLHMWNARDG